MLKKNIKFSIVILLLVIFSCDDYKTPIVYENYECGTETKYDADGDETTYYYYSCFSGYYLSKIISGKDTLEQKVTIKMRSEQNPELFISFNGIEFNGIAQGDFLSIIDFEGNIKFDDKTFSIKKGAGYLNISDSLFIKIKTNTSEIIIIEGAKIN